jgi:hypothetical protein
VKAAIAEESLVMAFVLIAIAVVVLFLLFRNIRARSTR